MAATLLGILAEVSPLFEEAFDVTRVGGVCTGLDIKNKGGQRLSPSRFVLKAEESRQCG